MIIINELGWNTLIDVLKFTVFENENLFCGTRESELPYHENNSHKQYCIVLRYSLKGIEFYLWHKKA